MSCEDFPMSEDTESMVDLLKIHRRPSRFACEGYDSNSPLWSCLRVLVVGAGGLGCELLHCLALSGFTDLEVIDMDTIELSNLNRQFLFREKDIGKPKATVAAEFVMRRCPKATIKAHFGRVESKDNEFYQSFDIILLGLDSIYARRWMCAKVAEIAEWGEGEDGRRSILNAIPMIDGGTEGYKGSVRVMLLGKTACMECDLDLYPPTKAVPLCTLENVPRCVEHCVLFVKEKTWNDQRPGEALDADNPAHVQWIMKKSQERQAEFNIKGTIDYPFTLGVIKNVVPAVGFTNAIVAACMVLEAYKLATADAPTLSSFAFYNGGISGPGSSIAELAPNESCAVCGSIPVVYASPSITPDEFLCDVLGQHPMRDVWKLEPRSSQGFHPDELNRDVGVRVFADGPHSLSSWVRYSATARLQPFAARDTECVAGRSMKDIILSKTKVDLSTSLEGMVVEATTNGLTVRVLLKPLQD